MTDEPIDREGTHQGTSTAITPSPSPSLPQSDADALGGAGADATYVRHDLRAPGTRHTPIAVPKPILTLPPAPPTLDRPIAEPPAHVPAQAQPHAMPLSAPNRALSGPAYGLGLVLGIGFGIVTNFFSFGLAVELLIYGVLGVGVTHLVRLRLERRLHIRRALFALLRND